MAAVEAETGLIDASAERAWAEVEKKTYTRFQEGDILFAKVTPCMENGKIAIASGLRDKKGVGSTEFHVLRPSEEVSHRYILHYLLQRSFRAAAERSMSGAVGLRRVPAKFLGETRIPLPPLAEQHRIVESLEEHLSRLDSAERLVARATVRARHLEEAVSAIAYGYDVPTGEPAAAPPTPGGTDDGLLPRIPASWTWLRLGEIADVVGGITKDLKKQSDPDFPEVPYLRVANVQRGWLDLSKIAMIRVPAAKAAQLALRAGDVLLNEGGDRDKLGRGWVWEEQIPGVIHQNHVFRARIRENIIHPKLLSWYANSAARWFEANGKQSVNLASISLSKIKQLPVPVPPPEEQAAILERIEGQLSMLAATARLSEQATKRSKALRRAILARAFSGELVPQDSADEPASVLLERIRAEREAQGARGGKGGVRRAARRPRKPAATVDGPSAFAGAASVPADAVQQELKL